MKSRIFSTSYNLLAKSITAMGISSNRQQCCHKCRPIWDLRQQKIVAMKFSVCGVYFHNLHHC